MSTLTDLRVKIKDALSVVDGLECYPYAPPQVNVPAAIVIPDGAAYNDTFEGGATYTFPVLFLVSMGDWESGQLALDDLVSHDGTAVRAINDATDIEAAVARMDAYGTTAYALTEYFSARIHVEVFT